MDIEIKKMSKKYDDKIVLSDLSLVLKDNNFNYIMGESGSGKTTLLNILMGLEEKDSGEIIGLDGRKISAVFQEDRLCEDFSAVKNIKLVCNYNSDYIKKELSMVGLDGSQEKPIKKLSGGMKRRVAIVRAILSESDILILDEPLKGLDEETKKIVFEYIKIRKNNRLIVMVTHDEQETFYIKGSIYNMYNEKYF